MVFLGIMYDGPEVSEFSTLKNQLKTLKNTVENSYGDTARKAMFSIADFSRKHDVFCMFLMFSASDKHHVL